MANTVVLSQSAYKEIITRLSRLEKILSSLLEKLEKEPPYGSDEWWEWSDKKALKDIEEGNYKTFSSAKELKKYLENL
jgi:hypothetical protein